MRNVKARAKAARISSEQRLYYSPMWSLAWNAQSRDLLPAGFAVANRLAPLQRIGEVVLMASDARKSDHVMAEAERLVGLPLRVERTSAVEIERMLESIYGIDFEDRSARRLASRLRPAASGSPDHADREAMQDPECRALAAGMPWVQLEGWLPPGAASRAIRLETAVELSAVPLARFGCDLVVVTDKPLTGSERGRIARESGLNPLPCLTDSQSMRSALAMMEESLDGYRDISEAEILRSLADRGEITAADLSQATEAAALSTQSPVGLLVDWGVLDADAAANLYGRYFNATSARLDRTPPEPDALSLVPADLAWHLNVLPLSVRRGTLRCATHNPKDQAIQNVLHSHTRMKIEALYAPADVVARAVETAYGGFDASLSVESFIAAFVVRSGVASYRDRSQSVERLAETVGDEAVARALALRLGTASVRMSLWRLDAEAARSFPAGLAAQTGVVVLMSDEGLATVAASRELDEEELRRLRGAVGKVVRQVIATPRAIEEHRRAAYEGAAVSASETALALVDHLVERNLIPPYAFEHARTVASGFNGNLDEALCATTGLNPEKLAEHAAKFLGLDFVRLTYQRSERTFIDAIGRSVSDARFEDPIDERAARLLPAEVGKRLSAIPFAVVGGAVHVAVADPFRSDVESELAQQVSQPVKLCVTPRSDLEEGFRRHQVGTSLGDVLIRQGRLEPGLLRQALQVHRSTGVRLGQALVSLGFVTSSEIAAALAEKYDLPYFDVLGGGIDERVVRLVPEEVERDHSVVPIYLVEGGMLLGMVDPLDDSAVKAVQEATGRQVERAVVSAPDLQVVLRRTYGSDYADIAANDLVVRYPDESARRIVSRGQKIFFLLALIVAGVWTAFDVRSFFIAVMALCSAFYMTFSGYKFFLIYRGLNQRLWVDVSDEEIKAIEDRDLPIYTILVPLYREAGVLPQLVRSIGNLDYPHAKLDVKLLLEADDEETIAAAKTGGMPPHFDIVVVPHGLPKGKPKACNYGLIHARGEFVVIYDAEDMPEVDQLKKVVAAYRKTSDDVMCIQCKLNYYNRNQNAITRWFTTEYSMWFDLLLPGLDATNAPIPLGGTSNHFRTTILRSIAAWDPYNVTEDADLGLRLYKSGGRTAVVNSTTFEEANSRFGNWLRQRSRWVKGYIQTYLVHMRHPWQLIRAIGIMPFFSFQMTVGGTFFGFLLNPLFWGLTLLWYATKWTGIQEVFPAPVFYLSSIGLYAGNFAFAYANVAGCMRRGYYELTFWAVLSPIYWAMMSIGAWKGLLQLFYRPFYWEKTTHGLFQGDIEAAAREAMESEAA